MTTGLQDASTHTSMASAGMQPFRSIGAHPIYMDHQAATPMDPRVVEVVLRAMTETFGNANNATHFYGEAASDVLEDAREAVGALVGSSGYGVRFTSGSTEAASLAFRIASSKKQAAGGPLRIVTSRIEHKAILEPIRAMAEADAATVTWMEVDDVARISLPSLATALAGGADLVCMMAANNEVGTIYPVEAVAKMVHQAGAELLVDATQGAGRTEIRTDDWDINYLIFNAHKLYGPKGIGALVGKDVRSAIGEKAAGHAGTPNAPAAAGFGEACRIALREGSDDERRISALRDGMQATLRELLPSLVVNGDQSRRLSHNLHVSMPGIPNDAVVARLRNSVAVATGSACNSGAQEPSHVLLAMGLHPDLIDGALRISPGRMTTDEDARLAAIAIAAAILEVAHAMKGPLS